MLKIRLNSLLYSLFLAGIFSAIAPLGINQPAATQELESPNSLITPTQLVEQSNSEQLVEQLIGRWELQLPDGKSSFVFIFAPDGEFFDLSQSDTAIRFFWVIDSTQRLPQVVIHFGLGLLIGNLSGSEMQMQILPLNPDADSQELQKVTFKVRKLSSDYSLPGRLNVIEAEEHYRQQAVSARQLEAKLYVRDISVRQQSYFMRYQRFVADIQIMAQQFRFKSQTDNYNYQIFLSENGHVANTLAMPRLDNLRAYVSRVATQSNGRETTIVRIQCESINPTHQPPSLPIVMESDPQCPADYKLLGLRRSSSFPSSQPSPSSLPSLPPLSLPPLSPPPPPARPAPIPQKFPLPADIIPSRSIFPLPPIPARPPVEESIE